jgi:hypothetical protein
VTAQLADEVRYRGRWYAVAAVDGAGLFDPVEHGLVPGPLSTACWRGYRCWYSVRRARLGLHAVEVGQSERSAPGRSPRLCGVAPWVVDRREVHGGAWCYRGLRAPVRFTGRLLLGHGFVYVGRLNMGFLPAWLYRTVHEVRFAEGRLVRVRNRSLELAVVRERLGSAGLRPADGDERADWIARSFSLDFDYSWPRPS